MYHRIPSFTILFLTILCSLYRYAYSQFDDNNLLPYAYLDISIDGGEHYSLSMYAEISSFGKELSSDTLTPSYELVLADDGSGNDIYHFGCIPGPNLYPSDGIPKAMILSRGNCSFTQKVYNAQAMGASAVLVYDGIAGKYFSTLNSTYTNTYNPPGNVLMVDECDSDCSSGTGLVANTDVTITKALGGYPNQCNNNNQCASKLCALTSSTNVPTGYRQICCIPNDYLLMGSSTTDPYVNLITIPVVFLTTGDGYLLLKYMQVMQESSLSLPSSPNSINTENKHRVLTTNTLLASGSPTESYRSIPSSSAQECSADHSTEVIGSRGSSFSPLTLGTIYHNIFGINKADPLPYRPLSSSIPVFSSSSSSFSASTLSPPLSKVNDKVVSVFTKLGLRPTSTFDSASIIIWLLGTFAAIFASYLSAAEEREQYKARVEGRQIVRSAVAPSLAPPAPPISLSPYQALTFLLFSAGMLVGLYFLVKYAPFVVVYIMMALFSFASITALRFILFHPILDRIMPSLQDKVLYTLQYPETFVINAATLICFMCSFTLVVVWLVFRQSNWAFVLQDIFGICLCCLFLLQIRLATLRTATIALTAFFCWDIFAVFITPYIFGSSVMMDVATAGTPNQVANQACYCRLHPDDRNTCGPGEAMPILLRIPRLNDFRGGYSMLGLGDIVIPGLLLSFLLRTDYAVRGPLRILQKGRVKYWTFGILGYFFGLAFANIAVVTMEMGQPALLYLVPCTLLPVLALAYSRGELESLWYGRIVDLEHSISGDENDLPILPDGRGNSFNGRNIHDGRQSLLQAEEGGNNDNDSDGHENNPLMVEDDPVLAYDPNEVTPSTTTTTTVVVSSTTTTTTTGTGTTSTNGMSNSDSMGASPYTMVRMNNSKI